jgi:hypothetical protein
MFVDATRSSQQSIETRREDQARACQIAQRNMLRVVQAITVTNRGGTPDLALGVRPKHTWRQIRNMDISRGIQEQVFLLTLNREVVAVCDGQPTQGATWRAVGRCASVSAWQDIPRWFRMRKLIQRIVKHGQLLRPHEVAETATSQTTNQRTAPAEGKTPARDQRDRGIF